MDRSRRYQRPLTRLRIIRTALGVALALGFVLGELGERLIDALDVNGWVAQLAVVLLALQLAALVYDVPLDWWVDLVHDKRWDLSTQTPARFVTDQLKSFVLTTVIGLVVLIPLWALIRSTDLWWVWGWLLTIAFSIGLGFVYPIVIAPIFNRFTPIEPGEISQRIDAVAAKAGVNITGTYVVDASLRSRRDNAYVAGLGKTRRVVLFDTLLEHPPDVVEQVVAHEIGHWRLHHLRRQVPLAAALALAVFVALALVGQWADLADPASLPLVALVAQGGFALTGVVGAYVSRAFERQADREALVVLGRPDRLIDMHRRIHVKNLADLDPSRIQRLTRSHPPAAERMAFARRWGTDRKG